MKKGHLIDADVVRDLLTSSEVGEQLHNKFINERLSEGRISFFEPLKKVKIRTGLEPMKKIPKIVNILKEDRQAFGELLGKAISHGEALSYPLTTVPLALASPDRDLRHGNKAVFRNYLIQQ